MDVLDGWTKTVFVMIVGLERLFIGGPLKTNLLMEGKDMTQEKEALYQNKKCWNINCSGHNLKKRKTIPYTANLCHAKDFEYWRCTKCKTNYAYPKQ